MLKVVHNYCNVIEHMMISYVYAVKDIFKIQAAIFEQEISV